MAAQFNLFSKIERFRINLYTLAQSQQPESSFSGVSVARNEAKVGGAKNRPDHAVWLRPRRRISLMIVTSSPTAPLFGGGQEHIVPTPEWMRPAVPTNPPAYWDRTRLLHPHPHLPLQQVRSLSPLQFSIDIFGTIAQHWPIKCETESLCQIMGMKQGG